MHDPQTLTLLRADRLVDGTGASPLQHAAVLLEGDLIGAVGAADEVRAPDGAPVRVMDYGDATLLPGLVDGHTHLVSPGDGTAGDDVAAQPDDLLLLRAAANARTMLHAGVTTIRENGAKGRIAFSVRSAIGSGTIEGPRMVASGRPVTITGGHLSYFGGAADGVDDLRRTVRTLVKEGADFIKIMATGGSTRTSFPNLPAFSPGELSAIIDEAHRFGRLTAAHAIASRAIADCLDAGIDVVIHCSMSEPDGSYVYRPELADRMAAAGVWLNPTIHDIRAWVWYYSELRDQAGALSAADQEASDRIDRILEAKHDTVRRLHAAGVRISAGSDSPWGRSKAGVFRHELSALVEAGLTPMQALVAGTSGSADSIGVGDRAGTLAAGRPADVLVVAGDPLADLAALGSVRDVFLAGQQVDRPARS